MHTLLKKKSEIVAWLDKYFIRNYNLVEDAVFGFVVDVDSSVDLGDQRLKVIPVKFGHINGDFDCSYNMLKSLENSPIVVDRDFYCQCNQLASLEHFPMVRGDIIISDNPALGSYQDLHTYAEIKEILDVIAEKNLLTINTKNSSQTPKTVKV